VSEADVAILRTKAWLVARSGLLAGTRYQLRPGTTRVGKSSDNDVVVRGPNTASVSGRHVEIGNDGGGWWIHDLGSPDGTYLDGQRIAEAELNGQAIIQLGKEGPQFSFVVEQAAPADVDVTMMLPPVIPSDIPSTPPFPQTASTAADGRERPLSDAVIRARHARLEGQLDKMSLIRDVLNRASRRRSRRLLRVIWVFVVTLVLIASFGYWKIMRVNSDKVATDERIRQIEMRLNRSNNSSVEPDRLLPHLDAYQGKAEGVQRSPLYRLGADQRESFVAREIRTLMSEFGAEVVSIPPEFVDRVNAHIEQYLGPDRPNMQRAIDDVRGQVATMQEILIEQKLPPDFAYIPLVESALSRRQSGAGEAGLWQFTVSTARKYGLRVNRLVDERKDLRKSTHAASVFLRKLILDFGNGSSVMLALAAYNLGPTKVRQAVVKTVEDPIKQRNFWYLYRIRALPPKTREYVPKVFAAIIIGRNHEQFGF
jgi:hypothetical protein